MVSLLDQVQIMFAARGCGVKPRIKAQYDVLP